MSPPVLLVDWYNTLSTSKFWQQWASPDHPLNHAFHAIQERWVHDDPLGIKNWMRGKTTSEQFVEALAKDVELDFDDMFAAFVQSCVQMRFDVPEVCVSVARYRSMGGRVYVATDNMDSLCRWTSPALGMEEIFDGVLSSHQVGYLKEDLFTRGESGFFKVHLEERGIASEDCLLIDDSETTCRAATSLGLRTYRVSGPGHAAAFLGELTQQVSNEFSGMLCPPTNH